jgi:hypothetical protein
VVTFTARSPNCRSGASTIVSATVEQFGLVTIAPGHPCAFRCCGISPRWSPLISGISSGTVGSMRMLRALEMTMCPAFANAGSMSFAALASSAENISRGPRPGTHPSTLTSRISAGGSSGSRHDAASRSRISLFRQIAPEDLRHEPDANANYVPFLVERERPDATGGPRGEGASVESDL